LLKSLRYAAVVLNGTKNPHRSEVLRDIRDAVIRTPSGKDGPAKYWGKKDQEERLIAAFDRWAERGEVWSTTAPKVSHGLVAQSVQTTLNIYKPRFMPTSLPMYEEVALHENVKTLPQMEAALRVPTRVGILFNEPNLVGSRFIQVWHMTLSCGETFALHSQNMQGRKPN